MGDFLVQIIVHTKDAQRLYATVAERAATCGPDWRSASGAAMGDESSWWSAANDESYGPWYWVLARKGENILHLGGSPNGIPDDLAGVQSLADRRCSGEGGSHRRPNVDARATPHLPFPSLSREWAPPHP